MEEKALFKANGFRGLALEDNNVVLTYKEDLINRNRYVRSLVLLLKDIDQSCSIALDGPWGSGKSFFVNQVKMIIDSLNPNNPNSKTKNYEDMKKAWTSFGNDSSYPPFISVYYDAWQHDNDIDPVLSLISEITRESYAIQKFEQSPDWNKVISSIASLCPTVNCKDLIDALKGTNPLDAILDQHNLKNAINDYFDALMTEHGNRFVIFIDELDRCSPAYAVSLLERIKHYFSNDRITFVFSVHLYELQKTIKNYYGNDFDSCRYLDRFFDLTMSLPPVDLSLYLTNTQKNQSTELRESVCVEVAKQLDMSMREFDRYILAARSAAKEYNSILEKETSTSTGMTASGRGAVVAFHVIIPIALGLKMIRSEEYHNFVKGIDSTWLATVLTNPKIRDQVFSLVGYSEKTDRKSDVKRAAEIYKAVLGNYKDEKKKDCQVASAVFKHEMTNIVIETVGLFSEYAVFDLKTS